LRDRLTDIRERGAELVIIGNGSAQFASAFREDMHLDAPLLVDPELRAYRAAGLRRGRVEVLSPRLPLNALRAIRAGHRQGAVQGDPWQLGGVFVIRPEGDLSFQHLSREAGDHPGVDEILGALDEDTPAVLESQPPGTGRRLLSGALSRLIDPTIAFSFDRTGFAVHSLGFDERDLDVTLDERRCAVTGANAGIGYETARALADLGAEVILLCRNSERGEQAAETIREETGNKRVTCERLDVSDLKAVREVAESVAKQPLDVLVHNAGVLPDQRIESPQGLELTWATHVIGPFVLTALLRDALAAAPGSRVIWVSSGGMYTRRLNLRDPNWTGRPYDGVIAYAETKRAQTVLSEVWADELQDSRITVNAMHPGWADTGSVRESLPVFYRVTKPLLRTAAQGADTVVWLAASERAGSHTGQFFFDRAPRCTHILPLTRESPSDRRALWALCEDQSGLP
jgi:NAD(P)-dependent dehydrogenase (short-subunit alcohol dehydrogenase family)